MEIILWFFLGLVFFIYFLYPVVIFLIAKLRGKELSEKEITPPISLIIPIHNEAEIIKDKINNTLTLDYSRDKLEIIFALDGCTDKTGVILEGYKNIIILDKKEREGKVRTLNKAVKQAKGEIIVFSDANSMYRKDALRNLVRNFADESIGCVCGKLEYKNAENNSVSKGENLYWKYEYFIKKQESRLGTLLITNGSIQAVRKNLYPFPDPEVADDFSIPMLIGAQGYKVLYEPEAVAYEVATQNLREEFNQKVRIISQGLKGIWRLKRTLLKSGFLRLFQLTFHKILRWLIPFFLMVIFVSNLILVNNPAYLYLFILQIVFYLFAFIGFLLRYHKKIKIFYIPFYFCLVNWAAVVAVCRVLKKQQTRMWDKAHSTRTKETKIVKGSV